MEKGDFCISTMASSNIAVLLAIGVITLLVIRIIYVINRRRKPLHSKSPRSLSTLIVLGSGGHTAEMLNLLYVLQTERFKPRYYIAAATDNMSLQKAHVFEDSLLGKLLAHAVQCEKLDFTFCTGRGVKVPNHEAPEEVGGAEFMQIYRSREVGQSYITSVGTTLVAIAHALWLMIKTRPQVILCNGPGTCIPLCVIAFLFKVLGIRWSSIFYVESIARVRKLSLSGLLLYKLHMADQLFVQWPQLKEKYPRAHYVGRLM
uniref:UDP-N-acetylglucosamine transferase subunit ALG14 n=1 Tax=Solanum lycopersicum TaxID=4081 RepID=A0A3Q7FCZ8_SOLLC